MSFKLKVISCFFVIQIALIAMLWLGGKQLSEQLVSTALEDKSSVVSKFLQPIAVVGVINNDLHWFEKAAKLVLLSDDVGAIRLIEGKGDVKFDEKSLTKMAGAEHFTPLKQGGVEIGRLVINLSHKAISQITENTQSMLLKLSMGISLLLFVLGAVITFLWMRQQGDVVDEETDEHDALMAEELAQALENQLEVARAAEAADDSLDASSGVMEPVKSTPGPLQESFKESLADEIVKKSPNAIILIDLEGEICQVNLASEQLFGSSESEFVGKNITDVLLLDHDVANYERILASLKESEDLTFNDTFESTLRSAKSKVVDTNIYMVAVSTAQGLRLALFIRDISNQRATEKRLDYLAFNDELTDLPNLSLLSDHLRRAIFEADAQSRQIVVIKLGLDRFKHVNESLGHRWGDYLLRTVAGRLKETIRRGDMVSRINGDQFVVVLVDVATNSNIERLAKKYVSCFDAPFKMDSNDVHVNVSIGATVYPGDEKTVDGLLRDAESAMFRAKERGGSSCQFFSSEMREVSHERLYLETELRKALDANQLELHYQPQVNLETGKIIGIEALLRWNHPQMGQVAPDKFISLAEDTGLIIPIGEWILREACRYNKELMNDREVPLILAVNLSPRQFVDNDLINTVATVLHDLDYPPEFLELEITETLLMENMTEVADTLQTLSDQGIRISMDDFGTGYSSLNYLKSFPINTLKVDRSFVLDLDSDEDNASIVRATIQMAHSLNIDIVAEGVETEAQLKFLANIQCDKIQGFYFSRPLGSNALKDLLDEDRVIDEGQVQLISNAK